LDKLKSSIKRRNQLDFFKKAPISKGGLKRSDDKNKWMLFKVDPLPDFTSAGITSPFNKRALIHLPPRR
jgi:hypothetical protein